MRDMLAAIRSANELAETVRRLHETVDVSRIARQVEDAMQSADVERFADSMLRQQRGIADAIKGYESILESVTLAADQLRLSVPTIEKWAPIYTQPDFLRVTAEAARRYESLFMAPAFAGVLDEVARLQEVVAPHIDAIRTAPDETSRRVTVRSALQAILKGATGLDTRFDSPEKLIEFITALIRWLITLQLAVQSGHQTELARTTEAKERRTVARRFVLCSSRRLRGHPARLHRS